MKILNFNDSLAKEIIKSGNVLALPTETVYGLGIRWDDDKAYEKLCDAKKRRPSKAIAVMCGTKFNLDEWFYINENIRNVITMLLPGPLTILIKAKPNVPFQAHLGTGVVGLRIPAKEELLNFLDSFDFPLQVTSANMSGEPSTGNFEIVEKNFRNNNDIEGIIYGECTSSIPSTVVDLTCEKPKLVRQGEISLAKIEKIYFGDFKK